ncbi:MAG: hypothetical protein AAFO69_05160 [Bacteroidota bacterium]
MIDQEYKIPTTLSADEERPAVMDFDMLREEAMEIISRLSPDMWTDHNLHDPGINILEELCYAITDLAYRLDYPMKDLLAHEDPKRDPYANLHPAYEIMPCMPVTQLDIRKVILDIPGVQNAWVSKDQDPSPMLYYHDKQKLLTFSARDAVPVPLSGLYSIKIQPEPDYVGGKGPILKKAVLERWHQCRSLGEDLTAIELIGLQNVAIVAMIEVKEVANPNRLMQQIFERITEYVSPSPRFYDMETMLEKGYSRDHLFSGPLLDHGFLDDKELADSLPREELRTSDLIKVLMQIPEVRLVKKLEMKVLGEIHPWLVEVEEGKLPQLDILSSEVQLLINGQPVGTADREATNKQFLDTRNSLKLPALPKDQRFPKPPKGTYQDLEKYTSIQHHLPAIYGVGEEGLASSAPDARKAAAKQLKAYLLLFEQILANQHAQLEHFKGLFAFDRLPSNSQFAQLLKTVPHADQVLNPWLLLEGIQSDNDELVHVTLTDHDFKEYQVVELSGAGLANGIYKVSQLSPNSMDLHKLSPADHSPQYLETPHIRYHEAQLLDLIRHMGDPINTSGERIHRFYDHLLARYGETIVDYSSFFAANEQEYLLMSQFLIAQKQQFLKHYQTFSQDRNRGMNYQSRTESLRNIAGLQMRIQLLLGIGTDRRKNLTQAYEHNIEAIRQHYEIQTIAGVGEEETLLQLMAAMTEFRNFRLTEERSVEIWSPDRKLLAVSKQKAKASKSEEKPETLLLPFWQQTWAWNFSLEGMHLIEHILLRPIAADKAGIDHFFHDYYLVESYQLTLGKTDDNGDKINTLYCTTQRQKPQQAGDVIYLSGVSDQQDIRATVLSVDDAGFETRVDSGITSTDHKKGFWYYGEAEREKAAIFMVLHHKISAFEIVERSGMKILHCLSANHGLQTDMWVDLQIGDQQSRTERIIAVEEDAFEILWNEEEPTFSEDQTGIWQHANARHDPYSLQLTMILPKWPGRMQNPKFRSLVEKTIRDETPAHHNVYVRWLDLDEMNAFEIHQSVWFKYLEQNGL